jgi:hypothetical protein
MTISRRLRQPGQVRACNIDARTGREGMGVARYAAARACAANA